MSLYEIEDENEVCECGEAGVYKQGSDGVWRCLNCDGRQPDADRTDEFSYCEVCEGSGQSRWGGKCRTCHGEGFR